ncbi:predicted protein [Nematostella vectensis]|uniref:Opsin n=1 Tax=Nematostella vectensis TaxID=45351 RepID=A7S8K8_NEMVE|nr:predicted protein [Nematostella vectensis]FAA00402.1 TPA: opsin [Nematostella vectensis]|eukprot:XP_001632018.1 predicted protein [Nematostella vectensis]
MTGSVFAGFVAVVFVFRIVSQIVTILIFQRNENRHFRLAPYFINTAISNLILILSSYPLAFVASLSHNLHEGTFICDFTGYLVSVGSAGAFVTMAVLTFEIYQHVSSEANIGQAIEEEKQWKTFKILGAIWIYSCLCLTPPLVGWSSMTLQSDKTNCAPNWVTQDVKGLSYLVFLTTSVFIIPMAVTGVYFYKLYRYFHNTDINVTSNPSFAYKLEHYKVTQKMVFAAITVNAICWSPYAIYSLASSIKGEELSQGAGSLIPSYFGKVSAIFNPIVYWIFNTRFRNTSWKIACCCLHNRIANSPAGNEASRTAHASRPAPTRETARETSPVQLA